MTAADVVTPAGWETYELVQPEIHLQRIRDLADLTTVLTYFQTSQAGERGIRYLKQNYDHKFAAAQTGDAVIKGDDIYAYSYHSAYGNSTDTHTHHVISIGGGIATNLHTRTAVLIAELGERALLAQDIPAQMLQPVLRLKPVQV